MANVTAVQHVTSQQTVGALRHRLSGIGCVMTLLLALLWVEAVPAHAVPASPDVKTLTQPDGSTFQARLWGDEWNNGWETLSGYTIVKDKQTANWTYAVPESMAGSLPQTNWWRKTPRLPVWLAPSGPRAVPPG